MGKNDRHVVPNPEGGWDVKAPGARRSSSHHDTLLTFLFEVFDLTPGSAGIQPLGMTRAPSSVLST